LKVHRSRSVRRAKVIPDGKNLISHAGAALLAELADRSGLTEAMSVAMQDCGINWHTHDPGVVLTHLAVAIANGADCLADLTALKEQEELFGPVASVATAWRALHVTTCFELRAIPVAVAQARERVWAAQPPVGPMIWDFDSTLLNVHAEKEDAAATYKGGFGFNPLGAWCDNTKEPLGAMLRPGNAAPGNTDDHLELLEQVVRSVPHEYALGHEEGDDPAMVVHRILVRADSAGASHRFVQSLTDANFDYSIGFSIRGSVHDALLLAQEEDWVRATEVTGFRDGAEVIELTEICDLNGWPADMRVICRRERPHPGAQLSLFDIHAGWRHTCFITNTEGDDIAGLELRQRGHARVEDRVRAWKTCGLANLPFDGFCANEAWVAVSLIAGSLLAWSQMTCFDGALAKAEPKTMRYRVLHVAAAVAHRGRNLIVHLDETWPWASELATAFTRLRAAFP
jgi:hypothetical protein